MHQSWASCDELHFPGNGPYLHTHRERSGRLVNETNRCHDTDCNALWKHLDLMLESKVWSDEKGKKLIPEKSAQIYWNRDIRKCKSSQFSLYSTDKLVKWGKALAHTLWAPECVGLRRRLQRETSWKIAVKAARRISDLEVPWHSGHWMAIWLPI